MYESWEKKGLECWMCKEKVECSIGVHLAIDHFIDDIWKLTKPKYVD